MIQLTGAPWVSQAANKRITQAAKTAIELEKIENLLSIILYVILIVNRLLLL